MVRGSRTMLPSPPASHDGRIQGNPAKPKPVRRDPERRRQQNIQAQRRYRQSLPFPYLTVLDADSPKGEKLKQRLDQLQRLEALNGDEEASLVIVSSHNRATASLASQESVVEEYSNLQSAYQHGVSSFDGDATETEIVYGSNDMIDFSSDLSLLNPIACDLGLVAPNASGTSDWTRHIDCGCLRPHLEIITVAGSRKYRDSQRMEDKQPQTRFDLYGNSLRVERLCIMQAVMANCEQIGITEAMLCDDDAISPFFRPVGGNTGDTASSNIVKKVQSIFGVLKPDMRPVEEQIISRHHPVIDALPFPTFRKNFITHQQTIDEDEFFDDLINGLVCWGGTGISRKNQNMSAGEVTSGTPWDSRSWEGKTWFLQKYWTILGGEDGELVRQSEWWRSMRGDESEVWPTDGSRGLS